MNNDPNTNKINEIVKQVCEATR